MQKWTLFLLLSSIPLCGLSQTSSQDKPLDDGEKRQILRQLYELEAARRELRAYEEFVPQDRDLDAKEREVWKRGIELEKQATALAMKEKELAEERARFYQTAYESVTKKRGFGCKLWRFVTIGIARCR